MNYYTNVIASGNNILYRGVKEGRRVKLKIGYSPTLFLPAKKGGTYKTLFGEPLEPKKFGSMGEARNFIKKYEDIGNFKIYGQTRFEYAFIAEQHPQMVGWDKDHISVGVIDIEVGSENGFPDPYKAHEPITAICLKYVGGKTYVWGYGEYKTKEGETYTKCKDEYTLIQKFTEHWQTDCPDIITGWNIKFFDIPYLCNRLEKLGGGECKKRLSPWGIINERKVFTMGKETIAYELIGCATLDYIELYRWYAPDGKSRESYRLDSIANIEIGENKLSFDEYDNLHQLFRLNHQRFIEYNIKDVDLILRLDDKLKLLDLAMTLAYDTKTNYEDVFAQTRMWDSMTYAHLLEKNIIVPPRTFKSKDSAFEGAYVKTPQVGMHNWVASFDLNSLYPHLMMQYCISPENIVERNYVEERKNKLIGELHRRNIKNPNILDTELNNV